MFCTQCSQELTSDAKFCPKCGGKVVTEPKNIATQNTPTRTKSVLTNIVYIISFIVTLVLVRGIVEFGMSYFSDEQSLHDSVEASKEKSLEYFADNGTWKDYNSVEGGFKTSFPVFPKHSTNAVEVPGTDIVGTVDLYVSEKNTDLMFIIQAIKYDKDIDVSNPRANLEGSLNGRLNEIANHKLLSSSFGTYGAHDSLDYVVQGEADGQDGVYKIYGKLILVDQRFYGLEMVCALSLCSVADYEKFINAFSLQ